MECINCGNQINVGEMFCSNCGTTVNTTDTVALTEQPVTEEEVIVEQVTADDTVFSNSADEVELADTAEPIAETVVAVEEPVNEVQAEMPIQNFATNASSNSPVNEAPRVNLFTQPDRHYQLQTCPSAVQLPIRRSLVKMIFLNIVTLGIYGTVIWSKIVSEINITASRYDGKRTCPYLAMCLLSVLTIGILPWVWYHKFSNRVGNELKRRGYDYKFGASTYWLWNVLGAFIIVGPFIYCHKLMKSMNMINKSYNIYG